MKNSIYKEKLIPIDKKCSCYTCRNFTLSYLYHLFTSQELLALQLVTNHNIFFMNEMMKEIRLSISKNDFENKKKNGWGINFFKENIVDNWFNKTSPS